MAVESAPVASLTVHQLRSAAWRFDRLSEESGQDPDEPFLAQEFVAWAVSMAGETPELLGIPAPACHPRRARTRGAP